MRSLNIYLLFLVKCCVEITGPESEHDISLEEQDSHNVSSEHTEPSDLDGDPENQTSVRPNKMTLNADQQVPSISQEQFQSSPVDYEDGKRDIRESCDKEAELVQEKAQSSNVDVGAVKPLDYGHNQGQAESLEYDQCSTSSSHVNPASTM